MPQTDMQHQVKNLKLYLGHEFMITYVDSNHAPLERRAEGRVHRVDELFVDLVPCVDYLPNGYPHRSASGMGIPTRNIRRIGWKTD